METINKIFLISTRAAFILLSALVISGGMHAQLSLPYSTGFDDIQQQSGWQQYRLGYECLNEWNIGTGIAPVGFSAPNCLTHDYNVGGSDNQTVIDWFVSPGMAFSGESKVSLKIRVFGFSEPLEDNLEILFGTLSQNPSLGSFVVIGNLSQMAPTQTWLDTILNIPFTANEGFLAIRYKTVGSNWKAYSIDDISITLNPVSVSDDQSSLVTRAFPNPFVDRLNIRTTEELKEISIADHQGRNVLTERRIGKMADIDLGQLAPGVYLLKVTTENGIQMEKIIKGVENS